MAELAISASLETTIGLIGRLLRNRSPSKEELEALKKNIQQMVKLSQETSYAAERYLVVTRSAVRAGVAVTELKRLFDTEVSNSTLISGISNTNDNRIVRELMKDSLQRIHEFRDDYDRLIPLVNEAEEHLRGCIDKLREGNKEIAREKISVAEKKLDDVSIFIGNRIDQIMKPLTRSFEILSSAQE